MACVKLLRRGWQMTIRCFMTSLPPGKGGLGFAQQGPEAGQWIGLPVVCKLRRDREDGHCAMSMASPDRSFGLRSSLARIHADELGYGNRMALRGLFNIASPRRSRQTEVFDIQSE